MNKTKESLVKAHGEKFNLDILKFKSLKSNFSSKEQSVVEDLEDSEESLEYISNDEALE